MKRRRSGTSAAAWILACACAADGSGAPPKSRLDGRGVEQVWVPAGVTLGDDGSAGTVDGLGARVRVRRGVVTDRIHVAGTEATDEHVSVVGTAGADQVNVVANGPDVAIDGATHGPLAMLSGIDRIDADRP